MQHKRHYDDRCSGNDQLNKKRTLKQHQDRKKHGEKYNDVDLSKEQTELMLIPDYHQFLLNVFRKIDDGKEIITSDIQDPRISQLLKTLLERFHVPCHHNTDAFKRKSSAESATAQYQTLWNAIVLYSTSMKETLTAKPLVTTSESCSSSDDEGYDVGPLPLGVKGIHLPKIGALRQIHNEPVSESIAMSKRTARSDPASIECYSQDNGNEFVAKYDKTALNCPTKKAVVTNQNNFREDTTIKESCLDGNRIAEINQFDIKRSKSLMEQHQERLESNTSKGSRVGGEKCVNFSWNRERDMISGYKIDKNRVNLGGHGSLGTRFSNAKGSKRSL